jgi:hypothetical protein
MNYYILALSFTIAICIWICINTFQKRKCKGTLTVFWIIIAIAWWSLAYLLEIVSKSFAWKLFWYRMEYIAIPVIPLLWLIFSLQYADLDKKALKKRIYPFLCLPAAITILVWTNDYHHFFIKDVAVSVGSAVSVIIKTNMAGYWANIAFSYVLVIAATFILMRSVFNLPSIYIKQGLLFLLGAFIPAYRQHHLCAWPQSFFPF